MNLRDLLRFTFRKKLPSEFGGGYLIVSPRADRRVLSPGWSRCAPDLAEVARRFVQRNDTVWDIGSNLGIFSAFAAGKVGENGAVFAVEPDPYYANLISRSASKLPAGYARIEILCAAVADRVGIEHLSVSGSGHAKNSLISGQLAKVERVIPVCITTLDTLCETWAVPNVLKIDVEGAESLVLKGATRILSEHRPKLYIEVSQHNESEVGKILSANNYSLFKLSLDGKDTPIGTPDFYTIALPKESIGNI